jgi:peptide/nickel transport system ATP-binding protein
MSADGARLPAGGAEAAERAASPVLSVRDLSVDFATEAGPLRALDGVGFDIARGEVLGVVGESGAGKSLTGMAIARMIQPPGRVVSGQVHLGGARIDTLGRREMRRVRGRRIGMIFQDPQTSLDPLFRIGDQLVETIRAHLPLSRRQARARAIDLLDEVGIPSAASRVDSYPHEFSGGMRQRVVIALAICAEPELVIADEPTTALDVAVQAQILDLLERLCRERGMAMMLVTHDMGVIAEVAHRVAVMYAGRIVEIGDRAEVTDGAWHPYAQGLMGAIPTLEGRETPLVQISGTMPRIGAVPEGCAFHPRCGAAFGPCARARPALLTRGGRQVACHLHDPARQEG